MAGVTGYHVIHTQVRLAALSTLVVLLCGKEQNPNITASAR
jgi:hypothetical protein